MFPKDYQYNSRYNNNDEQQWSPMPPPMAPPAVNPVYSSLPMVSATPVEEEALQEIKHNGLGKHTAKVAVILDVSYSMEDSFRDKSVHKLLKKAAAIAASFDDDGELDVFTFGQRGEYKGATKPHNIDEFVDNMVRKKGGLRGDFLESQTDYSAGIKVARDYFFPKGAGRPEHPVFAIFVTDGECTPNKEDLTKQELKEASKDPMFLKILAVGLKRDERAFVQELDDMPGRRIDNVDTVFAENLDVSVSEMIHEYRGFVKRAKEKRMFTSDPKIDFSGLGHEGRVQDEAAACCVIS